MSVPHAFFGQLFATYAARLGLIITGTQHKGIWTQRREGLYIVIITEKKSGSPRRCETEAAMDTKAHRDSALRLLANRWWLIQECKARVLQKIQAKRITERDSFVL